MRTFFISDLHGYYDSFLKLLDHVQFDPEIDCLIIGGDMINRGPKSAEVLQWVREHSEKYPNKIHALLGNHEEMMIWFMKELSPIWMEFGGEATIESFKNVFGSDNGWDMAEDYSKWIETLPLIYEDEHAVYTHSGVDLNHEKANQPRDIVWASKKDLAKMNEQSVKYWSNRKLIFRGHSPSENIYVEGPFVHCDLGCGVKKEEEAGLGLVEVKEKRYFKYAAGGTISEHEISNISKY